jgi:hypothetical protein
MPILSPQLTREGFMAKLVIGHGLVSRRNYVLDTLKPNNIQYQLSKLVRARSNENSYSYSTNSRRRLPRGYAKEHASYPVRQWSCSTRM